MDLGLTNARVVVTGGASNIGRGFRGARRRMRNPAHRARSRQPSPTIVLPGRALESPDGRHALDFEFHVRSSLDLAGPRMNAAPAVSAKDLN